MIDIIFGKLYTEDELANFGTIKEINIGYEKPRYRITIDDQDFDFIKVRKKFRLDYITNSKYDPKQN